MATAMPSKPSTQPPKDNESYTKKVNQWLHTYANVTKPNPKQQIPQQKTTREQRKSNTYTFFNLMTAENITDQIIRELVEHFGKPAKELLTKVCRDTRFRSRYQVTFQNEDDIENLISNGITINGIRVRGASRGQVGDRPVRFYIPNLPSYINEDEVESLFENAPCYVKEKFNKEFGIPTGGFFVGFFGVEKEDTFVELDGQSYKVVCIDKPRIRLPAQTESQESAELVMDTQKETSETSNTTPQQQITAIFEKKNDSETKTNPFKVAPNQQVFTFNGQKDNKLMSKKHEQHLVKNSVEKRDIRQGELQERVRLTNTSYCDTSSESESTKSGDTIKTTNSNMSTKRKKTTKKKHREKK